MCCVVVAIEQVSCSVFVGEVNEKEKKKEGKGKKPHYIFFSEEEDDDGL